ncbi:MAG TPA: hypothetical protein DGU02_11265 [Alphaproteobacteria bacterium]|nr:hypothetical protein [Alphaproteobacteria bacterium]
MTTRATSRRHTNNFTTKPAMPMTRIASAAPIGVTKPKRCILSFAMMAKTAMASATTMNIRMILHRWQVVPRFGV